MGLMTSCMKTMIVCLQLTQQWGWAASLHTYIYLEEEVRWRRSARCGASSMQLCTHNTLQLDWKLIVNAPFIKLTWGFGSQQETSRLIVIQTRCSCSGCNFAEWWWIPPNTSRWAPSQPLVFMLPLTLCSITVPANSSSDAALSPWPQNSVRASSPDFSGRQMNPRYNMWVQSGQPDFEFEPSVHFVLKPAHSV